MKRPDEQTQKMIEKELERMIEETLEKCSSLEYTAVIVAILGISQILVGLPIETKRRIVEILHKYYSMMEGLEKR